MAETREFKCPSCGGTLTFNSTVQKMRCSFCGNEYETEALEAFNDQIGSERPDEFAWEDAAGSEWQEGEKENLRIFLCQSCGGELMADENTAATTCPFCGNQIVLTERVSGALRPDYVIPFKLDKEAAKAAYRKLLKGKVLLPKLFKDENHIDEIKGIYVPFWLFDADADASMRYNGTKKAVWDSGDFVYTRTSYYSIFRQGSLSFDHVPVDGSEKMPDDLMEAVEPYDFKDAVDFKTAYLAGYLADKYDVTAEASVDRANQRIRESTENAFRSTVSGYQDLIPQRNSIRLRNGITKYALYPVWILNTTWNGKKYTFAMNGQTGKIVGDLPADTKKFALMEVGLSAVFSLLALLIIWFVR